jgi:FkbM family methyltransferase
MTLSQLKTRFRSGAITKPEFIREALELHRVLFDYVETIGSTDVDEIRIARGGVEFLMRPDGIRMCCPPDEARVAPIEIMNFDHYEPAETRMLDVLSAHAKVILDVGANIGWYAVRFAKRYPGTKVYAFEPMPTSYAYLQRNIAANRVGDAVTAFSYGLSDVSGAFEMFVAPAAGTNASLKNVTGSQEAVSVVCLTLTLDQWVANERVVPDLIKCDVEGAELLVFRGGAATLRDYRPMVFAELLRKWSKPFGYHPDDMLKFFRELGYGCFAVGGDRPRRIEAVTDATPETNYAFLHEVSHAGHIASLGCA